MTTTRSPPTPTSSVADDSTTSRLEIDHAPSNRRFVPRPIRTPLSDPPCISCRRQGRPRLVRVIRETIKSINKVAIAACADHREHTGRAGAAGQGLYVARAALTPMRSAAKRIFSTHPGRQSHQGHAGSGQHIVEIINSASVPSAGRIRGSLRIPRCSNGSIRNARGYDPSKAQPKNRLQTLSNLMTPQRQPRQRKAICPAGRRKPAKAKGKKPKTADPPRARKCADLIRRRQSAPVKHRERKRRNRRKAGRTPPESRRRLDADGPCGRGTAIRGRRRSINR